MKVQNNVVDTQYYIYYINDLNRSVILELISIQFVLKISISKLYIIFVSIDILNLLTYIHKFNNIKMKKRCFLCRRILNEPTIISTID